MRQKGLIFSTALRIPPTQEGSKDFSIALRSCQNDGSLSKTYNVKLTTYHLPPKFYLNLIAFNGLILLTNIEGIISTNVQITIVTPLSNRTSLKWTSIGT